MIKAKKKFGQNFLKDKHYLEKIAQAMPNTDNLVIEIGPGLGDLTEKLLEKRQVKAIEIDKELCEILKQKFPNLDLVCGDVLEYWHDSLADEDYDLVANLPYYIATNIILRALKDKNAKNIVVLIQKEVADKFSAKPGDKNYGSLSILASQTAEVKKLFDIPPAAFVPAPKVTSSVIEFKKFKDSYNEDFANFLKIAFSNPRKTLKKNLSAKYDFNPREFGLADTIRPHQVDAETFFQLFSALKERSVNGKRKRFDSSTSD
ncbi:MAG: 16S rRNA (adenine(1518)-N(6)/adenine(1519)-N(6))-dimethyltransferase RsmA [Nautiliaceae bacterium]